MAKPVKMTLREVKAQIEGRAAEIKRSMLTQKQDLSPLDPNSLEFRWVMHQGAAAVLDEMIAEE